MAQPQVPGVLQMPQQMMAQPNMPFSFGGFQMPQQTTTQAQTPQLSFSQAGADRKQNLKSFDGSKTVVACRNVDVDGTCSSPFYVQSMKHEDMHDEVFGHEASHGDVFDHDVGVSGCDDGDAGGAGEDSPGMLALGCRYRPAIA